MADKLNVEIDFWVLAVALLIVAFSGEPDLVDALIYKLTDGAAPLPPPTD